ncbi:MAG: winged helix-turn-helix transcriptional regulator, partial [Pseudomonadota bacterium]
ERWAVMVVVALAEGPCRSAALRGSLQGVWRKMPARRRRGLERDGPVAREAFDEMPRHLEHSLAGPGRRLPPAVAASNARHDARQDARDGRAQAMTSS